MIRFLNKQILLSSFNRRIAVIITAHTNKGVFSMLISIGRIFIIVYTLTFIHFNTLIHIILVCFGYIFPKEYTNLCE